MELTQQEKNLITAGIILTLAILSTTYYFHIKFLLEDYQKTEHQLCQDQNMTLHNNQNHDRLICTDGITYKIITRTGKTTNQYYKNKVIVPGEITITPEGNLTPTQIYQENAGKEPTKETSRLCPPNTKYTETTCECAKNTTSPCMALCFTCT